MRFSFIFKCLLLSSAFVSFIACNDDTEGFTYIPSSGDEGILDVDTLVVNEDARIQINTPLKGTDKIVAVSASGSAIYLDWGYEFNGMNEDGSFIYNQDISFAKVVFDDKWQYGTWTIYVENGNERKSLGNVMMVIVKTQEHKPLKSEESYAGLLEVAADGWAFGIDSIEYFNTETKTVDYKEVSSFVDPNTDYNYDVIKFDYNLLNTGNYDVRVKRWNYDFIQTLGNFDYFRNGLVDTLDITTYNKPELPEYQGRYYIDFYLDEVKEDDKITVVYDTGKTSKYDETLDKKFYNETTRIYTTFVPENKVKGGKTYTVTLKRGNANITFPGGKLMPETAE